MDLILRKSGAQDATLCAANSTYPLGSGNRTGEVDADVACPAADGAAGDLIIYRIKMTQGTSGFIEIGSTLTLPQ